MNAKTILSAALVLTALSMRAAQGQTPGAKIPVEMVPPPSGAGPVVFDGVPGQAPAQNMQLSSWITGDRCGCGGPCGCSGPIQTELFFRIGPSLVAGHGTIADVLQTGLYMGAGGKSLFFDPSATSAWTVELSIANINNHAHAPTTYTGIPLNIFVPQNPASPVTPPDSTGALPPQRVFFGKNGVPGVTVRDYNRTFFDVGGGREYYLCGSAGCGAPTWRVGCDTGGRWGSANIDFNEIRHRSDVIGGVWLAAHSDIEIPCGCCMIQGGLRVEYAYTWSDILQIQNKSDVQDVNILFNLGIRF
ncbi:MAG TPA: hypothetical protein VE988_23010 [Gemmataceae bacterium]|nr:hypothetical protein [Gemmataceae bacterium]